MAYVVAATWTAVEGKDEVVAEAPRQLAIAARGEEGCLMYLTHRSTERPRKFFIYEQYLGKEAFDAHVNSAHFQQYGREMAVPHLETRGRNLYELLD